MLKIKKKLVSIMVIACLLTAGTSFTGWAAAKKNETRNPIDLVSINVTSYVEAGDETGHLEVTSESSQYSIGNTEWSTVAAGGWKAGDEPKVKIYLHAHSGNYFNKTSGNKKILVNGATYASVKRDDNDETLIISIKLKPVKGDLEDPSQAEWVGYPIGKATWTKVASATAYELKLYCDNTVVYSIEKSIGTTFDFYPFMTKAGTYQFKVRAVPKSTEEQQFLTTSEWVYSDQTEISGDETMSAKYNNATATQMTNPSQIGWVEDREGWWYRNTDGSYPKNTWKAINDKWYLFGYDGYMKTGWQKVGLSTYYLSDNGDMQSGWRQINRLWYYLDPADGHMASGWVSSNGKWYYLSPGDGTLTTGWILSDGKWYYLNPNDGGAMTTNARVGGHYVNENGVWIEG